MIARPARVHVALAALAVSACAGQQAQVPQAQIVRPERVGPAPAAVETAAPPPLGTDGTAIRAEYGAPDFVRSEIDSQLWRYDGGDCALFFFLYQESGSYVLRHAETAPAGDGGAVDAACLSGIKERRAPSS